MKKYLSVEIEVSAIRIDDVITSSIKLQDSGYELPLQKADPEVH